MANTPLLSRLKSCSKSKQHSDVMEHLAASAPQARVTFSQLGCPPPLTSLPVQYCLLAEWSDRDWSSFHKCLQFVLVKGSGYLKEKKEKTENPASRPFSEGLLVMKTARSPSSLPQGVTGGQMSLQ